jgi:hypothetical protein
MNNKDSTFYVDTDMNITLNVTASDVPTLLKRYWGDYAFVSKDAIFLCVDSDIYCRQDKYDELKARIEEGSKMELYASQYQSMTGDDGDIDTLLHIFTDEERILLDKIESSSIKKTVDPVEFWDGSDYIYITDMYLVSEDGLFREYRSIGLCRTKNQEYFWEKYEQDEYVIYKIPKEYIESIETLFAKEIEAAEKYKEYVDGDYEE